MCISRARNEFEQFVPVFPLCGTVLGHDGVKLWFLSSRLRGCQSRGPRSRPSTCSIPWRAQRHIIVREQNIGALCGHHSSIVQSTPLSTWTGWPQVDGDIEVIGKVGLGLRCQRFDKGHFSKHCLRVREAFSSFCLCRSHL